MATGNELGDKSDGSINDASLDPLSEIKNLRLRNVNKVIIGNININSLPNKFEQLKELVIKHIDVLVITETKLDDSFPTSQFTIIINIIIINFFYIGSHINIFYKIFIIQQQY